MLGRNGTGSIIFFFFFFLSPLFPLLSSISCIVGDTEFEASLSPVSRNGGRELHGEKKKMMN